MKTVRMTTSLAGVNFSHACGAQVTLEDATADQWVTGGIAEYTDGGAHETATLKGAGVEKATTTHTRKRRG